MYKSKLLYLLRSFNKKELKRFGEYVHSPFFNKNKKVGILFNYVKKYEPVYEHPKLKKEKVYEYIFKEKHLNEQSFRNLTSILSKLAEDFLVYEWRKKGALHQHTDLLFALFQKGLEKELAKKLKEIQRQKETEVQTDIDFLLQQYLFEEAVFSFNVAGKARLIESDLTQVVDSLDRYYLANKLRYSCALVSRKSIIDTDIDLSLSNVLANYVEEELNLEEVPLLKYYLHLFKTLKEEDNEQHYWQLKSLLTEPNKTVAQHELGQIYSAVFNYCNKKLKAGRSEFLREIFDWYKIMLNDECLIINGFITPYVHFRNIVKAALRLGETKWAAEFIENYQDKLAPEHRENMINYCLAVLHFYQQDYRNTLTYLIAFELKDFYHYIEHKILLIQTYYELEEEEPLAALLNAFKVYLTRNTSLPEHFLNTYKNFIRFTEELNKNRYLRRVKLKKNTKNLTEIFADIEAAEYITEKEWLKEKARG